MLLSCNGARIVSLRNKSQQVTLTTAVRKPPRRLALCGGSNQRIVKSDMLELELCSEDVY